MLMRRLIIDCRPFGAPATPAGPAFGPASGAAFGSALGRALGAVAGPQA